VLKFFYVRHVLTFAFHNINCVSDGLISVWLCVTWRPPLSVRVAEVFSCVLLFSLRTAFRWLCVLCPPGCCCCLGEYHSDNGDVGGARFEFENDELDKGDGKIVEA
jgi:hypothetical protein